MSMIRENTLRYLLEAEYAKALEKDDALVLRTLAWVGVSACPNGKSRVKVMAKDLADLYWQAYKISGAGTPEMKWAMQIVVYLAIRGYKNCREILGTNLYEGALKPRDPELALYWLMRADLEGDKFASYGIGRIYADRRCLLKDCDNAALWLERSILGPKGNEIAKSALAKVIFENRDWYCDPVRAKRLLSEVMQLRHAYVPYGLKNMFDGFRRLLNKVKTSIAGEDVVEKGAIKGMWVADFGADVPKGVLTVHQRRIWVRLRERYAGQKCNWNVVVKDELVDTDLLARIRPYVAKPIVKFPK